MACFLVRNLARGAPAPVDDFGFIDEESVVVGCLKARRVPDGTIDINHLATATTHQMVMVVVDAVLVAGW